MISRRVVRVGSLIRFPPAQKLTFPKLPLPLPLVIEQFHSCTLLEKDAKIPTHAMITLLDEDTDQRSSITYGDALKLAHREKKVLKQKQINECVPEFCLVPAQPDDAEQEPVKATKMKQKAFHMKDAIADHELQLKIDHMIFSLEKGHNVKVQIERTTSKQAVFMTRYRRIKDEISSKCDKLAVLHGQSMGHDTIDHMMFFLRSNKSKSEKAKIKPISHNELKDQKK